MLDGPFPIYSLVAIQNPADPYQVRDLNNATWVNRSTASLDDCNAPVDGLGLVGLPDDLTGHVYTLLVFVNHVTDLTGEPLESPTWYPAGPLSIADVQTAMTNQGYTEGRGANLDNLDAAISSVASQASLNDLQNSIPTTVNIRDEIERGGGMLAALPANALQDNDARLDNLDGKISDVTQKTDNLPADPASQAALLAAIATASFGDVTIEDTEVTLG